MPRVLFSSLIRSIPVIESMPYSEKGLSSSMSWPRIPEAASTQPSTTSNSFCSSSSSLALAAMAAGDGIASCAATASLTGLGRLAGASSMDAGLSLSICQVAVGWRTMTCCACPAFSATMTCCARSKPVAAGPRVSNCWKPAALKSRCQVCGVSSGLSGMRHCPSSYSHQPSSRPKVRVRTS